MGKGKELKNANSEEYLTTDEAAKALGIKPTAIRNYLHAGKMTTYKFKTLTLVKVQEVQDWKNRQRKH